MVTPRGGYASWRVPSRAGRVCGAAGRGCGGKHAQPLLSLPRRACALLLALSVRQLVPAFSSPRYCSKSDSQEGKHLTEFKINSAVLVYFDEYFLIIFLCLSGVWLINASS